MNTENWKKIVLVPLVLILTPLISLKADEKPFVVVIPSYNNRDWYAQNLSSVFSQDYHNYRVIYVADAPTDGTEDLVMEYVKENNQERRFTLIHNKENNGPLACMCQAIFLCDKNEIVVDLDGNDWLAHDEVLSYLNDVYQDLNVWMTFGQFIFYPDFNKGFAHDVPREIIDENRFRSYGGAVTHLKTFYAGLFQEIKKQDFLWNGKFISKAYDLAYSTPILEMCGDHIKFIHEVLYVYNRSRPLNDHKGWDESEEQMDRFVRSKEKYAPLEELPLGAISDTVYGQIHDIYHPTISDYRFIQDFLSFGYRENIERLGDMEDSVRKIKIIGDSPDQFPKSGRVFVNADADERENCLLIYATYNRNYPNGLKRLLNLIAESDFKGHILYQLGGWPDLEGGSLELSHVPYAFKSSFFKQAQRMGYKRVLWLDTAVVPLVSLNDIFSRIEKDGYFVMGNSHMLGPWMNADSAAFFGLTLEQTYKIPSCSAGLFGLDLTSKRGKTILDWWYRAAHDKDAFFSARSDQSALSMILYLNQISNFVSLDQMPHSSAEIRPDSLFWLDREFVFWGN